MTSLQEIAAFFDQILCPQDFEDYCTNGLQVEIPGSSMNKIAFAVDAGHSVISAAAKSDANMLVVHHGIFWNDLGSIKGNLSKKLQAMFQANLSLYAAHLPLDANKDVGNNYELAKFFELQELKPFAKLGNSFIGVAGTTKEPKKLDFFAEACKKMTGFTGLTLFDFGVKEIKKVGILSGSGGSAIEEAADAGLDLLISGEPKHEHYHIAKENNMNCIFAGHYATETFGVLALKKKIEENFKNIETIFINEPTGV